MKPVLLDTGPVVALLDQADSSHVFVRTALAALPGRRPLLTTGAVITEVMFYLQDSIGGIERAVSFLADAGVYVEDAFTGPRLRAAAALMEQYADTPMDFADATLVVLATHFATGDILTLDERGFRTYRHQGKRSFRLLLQDALSAEP